MDEKRDLKVIFTPQDEPYLGRETLRVFDELIFVCLEVNSPTAPRTHKIEKNDLQLAACRIIPSGIGLALSIRELVRQGYFYGNNAITEQFDAWRSGKRDVESCQYGTGHRGARGIENLGPARPVRQGLHGCCRLDGRLVGHDERDLSGRYPDRD